MNTPMLLGFLLMLWLAWGYMKHRRIETVNAQIFYIGIGSRPLWPVYVNKKLPWYLSYIPTPFPFTHVWIRLAWWELVKGTNKKNDTIVVGFGKDKGKVEPKYKETQEFPTMPGYFLGKRDEFVPSIRILETVTYNIPGTVKEGYSINIFITFAYLILDALKILTIPNFKMYGEMEVLNQMVPWMFEKGIEQVHATNVSMLKDPEHGIIMPDGSDLETFLDEKKFKPAGFEISKTGIVLVDSPEAKRYFELKSKGKDEQQRGANADITLDTRKKQLAVELLEEEQESLIITKRLEAVQKGIKDGMEQIYQGEKDVQGARPNLLFEETHESNGIGKAYVENLFKYVIPMVNKSTSQKKFEKEELDSVQGPKPGVNPKKEEVTNAN